MGSIAERLRTKGGRDFTLAVLDAFTFLGFEVEDIEETQGTQAHSDLIVKAHLATHPYFVVLECTAVRQGSEVGYTNLYQLGSSFPRYLTKYGKEYSSASYKMLVGRPSFSSDTKKLATDTALLTADVLVALLSTQEGLYLSQDELEGIFRQKGEITEKEVFPLCASYWADAMAWALVYLSLLDDPTNKSVRRRKKWTNIEHLKARAKHWTWLLEDLDMPDWRITQAMNTLSSSIARALEIDDQNIRLSSLPFKNVVKNMGDLGVFFEQFLMGYIEKAAKLKQSAKG